MTAAELDLMSHETVHRLADGLVRFMESNEAPAGLFSDATSVDLTLPRWRIQAVGSEQVVATRRQSHPALGRVRPTRLEPTATGFVLEFEERWTDGGEDWYCREMLLADVTDGAISELHVYCTGDWDSARVAEHAAAVSLVRS
jgi:hypothetical protein